MTNTAATVTAPRTTTGTCQTCRRTDTVRHTVQRGPEALAMCPACAAHYEP